MNDKFIAQKKLQTISLKLFVLQTMLMSNRFSEDMKLLYQVNILL